ncbi:hypothetical protein [uncultured Brevundimonas sp.]|uniref:hypothetical protein n=1 Tax=uncultured Brevundimonas sp. TaxID=213418 RepID=UPI00262467DC|nr:hypothetical protein [uncultured Brevundimonas sp.]
MERYAEGSNMYDELTARAAKLYRGNGGAADLAREIAVKSAQLAAQKAKEAKDKARLKKSLEAA